MFENFEVGDLVMKISPTWGGEYNYYYKKIARMTPKFVVISDGNNETLFSIKTGLQRGGDEYNRPYIEVIDDSNIEMERKNRLWRRNKLQRSALNNFDYTQLTYEQVEHLYRVLCDYLD